MEILLMILTIAGLSLFEIVSSIDNAVINADVLRTMSEKGRRWFLTWGLFFAVFLVRGLLPFLIIFALHPSLGVMGTITAAFNADPSIALAIESAAPPLLAAGGIFLLFLFIHWLFMEDKHYGLRGEKYIHERGFWFYAAVSLLLTAIIWFGINSNSLMAFGAAIGGSLFFIVNGFREQAEQKEKEMLKKGKLSDISKLLYLEVIDASFSIDGVLGAFAFTLAVPLILIGNGIGAIVLRQITVSNIDNIKKYKYLKNGAMYSIAALGVIMLLEGFGAHIPVWLSPIVTISVLAYFFYKSHKELKLEESKK
ncbi:MAG: DUF475 domain-containing protein [Candidatus Aenigmarchaeota archaeon]|nr:DUF475 domain-containing protein [Candidatus Aenigmarchaeota archaeon]